MRIISIFVFTFLSVLLTAQEAESFDQVTLTDGSVLRGEIIDQDYNSITLINQVLDTVVLKVTKVSSIQYNTTEEEQKEVNRISTTRSNRLIRMNPKTYKESGYFAALDFGIVSGDELHWHSNITLGTRLTPDLYIGIQGGKENTKLSSPIWDTQGIWALGAYARYYPLKTDLRPFVSARIGYGFQSESSAWHTKNGGLNIAPGIGLHFKSRGALRMYVAMTQNLQKVNGWSVFGFNQFGEDDIITYDLWLNRTVVKVGMEF